MTNTFVEIIFCKDKKLLAQLCKAVTVTPSDFVDFIIACKASMAHRNHTMHFMDYFPDHLIEVEEYLLLRRSFPGSKIHLPLIDFRRGGA